MISGLTEAYSGFVTYIQQHNPLPTFAVARSRLELEESTMVQRAARESNSSSLTMALLAKTEERNPNRVVTDEAEGRNNNSNYRGRNREKKPQHGGRSSG
jgi:hypothetical protein